MSDRQTGNSGALIGGFLLGTAVGAISGLLLAPKTGKETRRLIKKSADALPDIAEDLSTSVQIQADRLSTSAVKNWDGTLGRLREAIAAGLEASRSENQRLSKKMSANSRFEQASDMTSFVPESKD